MKWSNINQFPSYICTTKDSSRIEFALKELSKAGISNVNLVYGINGSTPEGEAEVVERAKEYEVDLSLFVKFGEAALAFALLEALTAFLNTDHTHMLWFEDDVIMHYNADLVFKLLESFDTWTDYNLIYLGTTIVNGKDFVADQLSNSIYWTDCTQKVVWGTQSMLIDRKGAEVFIKNKNILQPIDMFIHKVARNKLNDIKTAGLLFPLLMKDEYEYNWKELYVQTDPRPWPAMHETLKNYKRSFGESNTCWGLFYQKNVHSILRNQTLHKSLVK